MDISIYKPSPPNHPVVVVYYAKLSQCLEIADIMYVLSSCAIHIEEEERERERVAFLLSIRCLVSVNVLWLFLTVPWNGLQFVIVVFPVHTHLLIDGWPNINITILRNILHYLKP